MSNVDEVVSPPLLSGSPKNRDADRGPVEDEKNEFNAQAKESAPFPRRAIHIPIESSDKETLELLLAGLKLLGMERLKGGTYTFQEIEPAWRRAAFKIHPDKEPDPVKKEVRSQDLQRLNLCFDALKKHGEAYIRRKLNEPLDLEDEDFRDEDLEEIRRSYQHFFAWLDERLQQLREKCDQIDTTLLRIKEIYVDNNQVRSQVRADNVELREKLDRTRKDLIESYRVLGRELPACLQDTSLVPEEDASTPSSETHPGSEQSLLVKGFYFLREKTANTRIWFSSLFTSKNGPEQQSAQNLQEDGKENSEGSQKGSSVYDEVYSSVDSTSPSLSRRGNSPKQEDVVSCDNRKEASNASNQRLLSSASLPYYNNTASRLNNLPAEKARNGVSEQLPVQKSFVRPRS